MSRLLTHLKFVVIKVLGILLPYLSVPARRSVHMCSSVVVKYARESLDHIIKLFYAQSHILDLALIGVLGHFQSHLYDPSVLLS